jgi:hypothetical protein
MYCVSNLMALSSSLRKVASKVVSKFGGDVTVRIVTGGSYNTTTGAITESESDSTVKGVLSDVSLREVNELIQAGDKRLLIAAAAVSTAPKTKDRVVISSVVHQVIQVNITEQANTAIVYELILRA